MDKESFLKEISSMSREEIDNYFKKSRVRTKKIYPLITISKEDLIKPTSDKKSLKNIGD